VIDEEVMSLKREAVLADRKLTTYDTMGPPMLIAGARVKSRDSDSLDVFDKDGRSISFSAISSHSSSNPLLQPRPAQRSVAVASNASAALEHGPECVICLGDFDDSNPVIPTLCNCGENRTLFHLPCLLLWIDKNRDKATCPACDSQLFFQEAS